LTPQQVTNVVIAGGGTAGWLAAAALSHQLGKVIRISLVESEEIGTIGVGEATIPPIRAFHKLLRIEEQDFMRATAATFKLGISFEDWARRGDRYIHSFGKTGKPTWMCEFHNFWLRGRELGDASQIGEYCFELQAARAGRFATGPDTEINYAYHLDAAQYARFLRAFSEANGITRIEGKIREVRQHPETGFIEALVLESGQVVAGDLFIDCTGFRGLLIEQTLKTGYEDWSHWLPCDSAAAVQTELVGPAPPYTRAIAHGAGWRWCIPLQHRVGNGLVFSSRHLDADSAVQELTAAVDGALVTTPRILRFQTGRRRQAWNKNCVALGLASGFIEPLESTSIHLMMVGVTRLMHLFPFNGFDPATIDLYNAQCRAEVEKTRDFIILHYHATERDDSEFWRMCSTMSIPDTLAQRIRLFAENAFAYQDDSELFRVDSWVQVLLGQRIVPRHYHPFARVISDQELRTYLAAFRADVSKAVARLPLHQDFVERYCRVGAHVWA
jgi:tryptophan 7-halogenase